MQRAPREQIFDTGLRAALELLRELQFGKAGPSGQRGAPWGTESHDSLRVSDLRNFLFFHVFAFLKPFDASTSDEDPQNFYMEREWRILGHVEFAVDEMYRIFLPEEYARRLRDDLPEFAGQVTFV